MKNLNLQIVNCDLKKISNYNFVERSHNLLQYKHRYFSAFPTGNSLSIGSNWPPSIDKDHSTAADVGWQRCSLAYTAGVLLPRAAVVPWAFLKCDKQFQLFALPVQPCMTGGIS